VFPLDGYPRPLRSADITDGTSTTFLAGEDLPDKDLRSNWPFSVGAAGTCGIPVNVRQPDGTEYGPNDWPNVWSFRSRHPGGAQFAFADGHVQFIANRMSLDVYRGLATVSGREAVSAD
jgi:prepilin-type processing-associated H-X9-DG protein